MNPIYFLTRYCGRPFSYAFWNPSSGQELASPSGRSSAIWFSSNIDIIGIESPWPDREKYPQSFAIDELRCIYCGMCEEACPVDAIELTSLYNLTGRSREEMIFDKEKLLSVFDMTKDKEPMKSPALGGTAT